MYIAYVISCVDVIMFTSYISLIWSLPSAAWTGVLIAKFMLMYIFKLVWCYSTNHLRISLSVPNNMHREELSVFESLFDTVSSFSVLFIPYSLSTKDVLRQHLIKFRSREIGCYNDCIVLKFVRHLGTAAAEMLVKLQSHGKSLAMNLAASTLHEIDEDQSKQNTLELYTCASGEFSSNLNFVPLFINPKLNVPVHNLYRVML